jgi:Tfp pilus assembly protein PilF
MNVDQVFTASDERRDEADLHLLRGDLMKATKQQELAEQSYQRALDVAQRQGAKLFQLRAIQKMVEVSRDQC